MRSIEEIIEYIKAKSEPWEIYIPDFVDAEKLLEFIGTKPLVSTSIRYRATGGIRFLYLIAKSISALIAG